MSGEPVDVPIGGRRRVPAKALSQHVLGSPTMRQPAKQMGPRAVRTVAQILAATKEIFLTHGYTGTTVDEIARAAGISRASFYTYFPSKRDVLLTLGAESARAASTVVENAWEIRLPWRPADIENFVHSIWLIMDEHAAFGFAWTQASHQDEEIRILGMKGQIQVCQAMGQALGRLRGEPFDDPKSQGLIMFSALERAWDYCQIYTGSVDALSLQHAIAQVIQAMLRDTQKQEMS